MRFPKIILVKSIGIPADSIEELEEIIRRYGTSNNLQPCNVNSMQHGIFKQKEEKTP
jgi:hypothetical protein